MAGSFGSCGRGGLLGPPGRLLGLLLLVAALLVAACDIGQEQELEDTPTSSPEPASSPAPTLEPTETVVASPDIEAVDFSQVPAVEDLVAESGGRLLPQEIVFADLTGDGADEAVVPISSGGSGGNVAYAVFGYRGGDLEELLVVRPEAGRVTVSVEDGALVETQPVYAPEDPLCCPSELRHAYYRWDGSELVVDHETMEKVPSAKP